MPRERKPGPIRLSLLALPETTPAALYGLHEVFSSVGTAWPQLTGEGEASPRFEVAIVSADGTPFTCAMGMPIAPHCAFAEAGDSDLVIVTDLAFSPDADPRDAWPEATAYLRERYRDGAIVCSVCTGSVLLAASGLLDGEEATTHWSVRRLFATCFPQVRLRPERIIAPCGDGHRIITGGGASSWEDLALYLIARLAGEAEAIRTAKVFLFGDRSEGQLPYAAMARPKSHGDAVIAECQSWVALNYDGANPVARMVERSGLAERTFKRRFSAATGYSPMDYVQTLRIEEAKQMLETGDMGSDGIARALGYEDPSYFRRLFKKRTGVTPARYRQRFRGLCRTG